MGANSSRSSDHSTPKQTLCTAESKEVGPPIPMERKYKRSNQRQKKQNTDLHENGPRNTHDFTLIKSSSKKTSQRVKPNSKVSRDERDSRTITTNYEEYDDGGYATIDDTFCTKVVYEEILSHGAFHRPISYTGYRGPEDIDDEARAVKSVEEENAEDLQHYYNDSEFQQSLDDSYDNSRCSHQGTLTGSISTTEVEDSTEPTRNTSQISSVGYGIYPFSHYDGCSSADDEVCDSRAEGAQAMTALSARGYFGSNKCNPTEEAEVVEYIDVPTHRQSSTDAVRDKDRTSVVVDYQKWDAIRPPQFTKINEELQQVCQRRNSGSNSEQTDYTDIDEPPKSSNHSTYDTLSSTNRISPRNSSTSDEQDVTDFSPCHSDEITIPSFTDLISQRPTRVQSISTTDGDVMVQDDAKEQFTSDSAYVRACQTFDLHILDKMQQHASFTSKKELLQMIEEAALESKRQFAMDCIFQTDQMSQTSLSACYKDKLEGHIKTQTKIIKTKYEAEKQKENEDKTSEINKLKEQVMMLQNRLNNSRGTVFV